MTWWNKGVLDAVKNTGEVISGELRAFFQSHLGS